MPDREKVIKGLETALAVSNVVVGTDYVVVKIGEVKKVLELLKDQEDIVRCKTCKYWDDTSEGRYIGGWCFCDRLKFSTSPEWYCADGEVKTDAVD